MTRVQGHRSSTDNSSGADDRRCLCPQRVGLLVAGGSSQPDRRPWLNDSLPTWAGWITTRWDFTTRTHLLVCTTLHVAAALQWKPKEMTWLTFREGFLFSPFPSLAVIGKSCMILYVSESLAPLESRNRMETSQSCCLPAGSLRRVAVYCRAKPLSYLWHEQRRMECCKITVNMLQALLLEAFRSWSLDWSW